MKERKIEWKEICRLKNGKSVIYHIKTKRINIESDYMYPRIPKPDEKEEILKILNKDYKKLKRWQKVLELIKKKL